MIILDYPEGLSVTTRVLTTERQEGEIHRRRNDNRNRSQREKKRGVGREEKRQRQGPPWRERFEVLHCWLSGLRKEP